MSQFENNPDVLPPPDRSMPTHGIIAGTPSSAPADSVMVDTPGGSGEAMLVTSAPRNPAPKRLKKLVLDLSSATASLPLNIAGTGFRLTAIGAGATLDLQLGPDSDPVTFDASTPGVAGVPFAQVWLTNAAQAGLSVTLVYWTDTVNDPLEMF